jgi:hypothetical protein
MRRKAGQPPGRFGEAVMLFISIVAVVARTALRERGSR